MYIKEYDSVVSLSKGEGSWALPKDPTLYAVILGNKTFNRRRVNREGAKANRTLIAHFDAQAQKLALWQPIVSPRSHFANVQLVNFLSRFASELSILC